MTTPDYAAHHADYEEFFDYRTPRLPTVDSPSASSTTQRDLPLLQSSDWTPDFQDDRYNPTCIHYDLEWRLQLRKAKRTSKLAELTEEDRTLAPGAYWDQFLSRKLATMVTTKLPGTKYEPSETNIIVSTEKRGISKIKLQDKQLDIDWQEVENKLKAWGHLFQEGHKLRLDISFVYEGKSQAVVVPTRQGPRGATGRQLRDSDQLVAQQEQTTGRPPVWREVYNFLYCTSVSCPNKGYYCWVHPESKKHYKLDNNMSDMIVDFAEEEAEKGDEGKEVRAHKDVPENIRQRIIDREEENTQRRQLKRKRVDDLPPINVTVSCPGHHNIASGEHLPKVGGSAELVIPMQYDKALDSYYEWQCNQVDDED